MKLLDLRILPPIAIGRLGSASIPLAAYDLKVDDEKPLDFRHIIPSETLEIHPKTGKIKAYIPEKVNFKEGKSVEDQDSKIHPVAPFLEVFAITDQDPDHLVPLTTDLLEEAGLSLADISWDIDVANIKLFRRTNNDADKIKAEVRCLNGHEAVALEGNCENFRKGKHLPLGTIQFVRPTKKFPEIRLRYTPGPGRVYGAKKKRKVSETKEQADPVYAKSLKEKYDFLIYKKDGDWVDYSENSGVNPQYTNPAMIFAGYDSADGEKRYSWGYLDDECDGFASVHLKTSDGTLTARAHISAGPPAFAPDTLPVRVVTDELEQILYGPEIEEAEVPIEEAEEIIRRAFETVRLMNTAIMNGNAYMGLENVASTMVRQDTNDFGRLYEPIMATSIVDNLALRALHERIFNGVSTGAAPWFENAIRRPDKIGDLSNEERRKMPGMMRGADGRALCLTHRQISTIIKSGLSSMFKEFEKNLKVQASPHIPVKDLVSQLHYRGKGNPFSVSPRSAISNCFPGLEFDFRNLWRRAFKEIVLIENNNYIVEADEAYKRLKHNRLVAIDGKPTMVPTEGPVFPSGGNQPLSSTLNPNGASFMEWSNNLAAILQKQGQQVQGLFTRANAEIEVVVTQEQLDKLATLEGKKRTQLLDKLKLIEKPLTVNTFFKIDSAELTDEIVQPGELTQGLCAPWQNDYRECACYYWAASRPDYINVVPDSEGLSTGDNWMTKSDRRNGKYIPDNRTDQRLLSYDDLFENWEGELNFIIKGFDSLDSDGNKTEPTKESN